MTEQAVLAMTTCPDEASARMLAQALVADGLAACVNELPVLGSTYKWEDRVHREKEILLLIKTWVRCRGAIERLLKSRHPYELPELIEVPITGGSEAYLEWMAETVRAGGAP